MLGVDSEVLTIKQKMCLELILRLPVPIESAFRVNLQVPTIKQKVSLEFILRLLWPIKTAFTVNFLQLILRSS